MCSSYLASSLLTPYPVIPLWMGVLARHAFRLTSLGTLSPTNPCAAIGIIYLMTLEPVGILPLLPSLPRQYGNVGDSYMTKHMNMIDFSLFVHSLSNK